MTVFRSRDGDSIPQILWLALGRTDDDIEEALYAINPGLESFGPILPAGINIKLPAPPKASPKEVVNVWD